MEVFFLHPCMCRCGFVFFVLLLLVFFTGFGLSRVLFHCVHIRIYIYIYIYINMYVRKNTDAFMNNTEHIISHTALTHEDHHSAIHLKS